MGLSLFASLLLLGCWAVLAGFIAGDRLKKREGSRRFQLSGRIKTALVLLGLAGVVGIITVLRQPVDQVYPAYAALALLVLGTGVTLSAVRGDAPAAAEAAARPRVTKRGWTALALLSSAQAAALLNDRIVETIQQVHVHSGTFAQILRALGLFFGVLGTCGAAWTFLTSCPSPDGPRPDQRWFNPRPWWTLAVLILGLSVLFLANALLPSAGGLLGMVLLMLGTATGLFGYLADTRARALHESSGLRISPRGWVSLGLLTLATGVLALNQTRAWTGRDASANSQARTDEVDPAAREELAQVRRRLAQKEKELQSLDSRRAGQRGAAWDSIPDSPGPYRPTEEENPRGMELPYRRTPKNIDETRDRSSRADDWPTVVHLDDLRQKPDLRDSNDREQPAGDERALLAKEVERLKEQVRQKEARLKRRQKSAFDREATAVNLSSWNGRPSGGRYAGRE
jgi:hypothetical protein